MTIGVNPVDVHSQNQGQGLDVLAQSMQATEGVFQDHPTSSTSVLDGNEIIGEDLGLDPHRQLSPPQADHRVYEDISPPSRGASVRQAPASSRDLHTPQHTSGSRSSSSSSSSSSSASSADSAHETQKQSSSKECFQLMFEDASATLPHLGEFEEFEVDPSATSTRVNELLTAVGAYLQELGQIAFSKSDVEKQYSKSVTALVNQRTVVRNFRDRVKDYLDDCEDSDDKMRELEVNRLKLLVDQHELSISQLKATLASKDAEIAILKEQLRRSDSASFKSPKGKALASKSPYYKRSTRPPKDVMLASLKASLQTPRHNYQY